MMHYGSWITPQQMMENRYYSSGFIEDPYRLQNDPRDEECEQIIDETHDTITTATSDERSSSADIFRLEFAATQRLKLVSNAEGLFNRLVASNILPHNEQDQIEQWLCMKQEYEECITSDETASLQGYETTRRSLERIEEVTETDEKTDESNPVRISSDTSMSDVDVEEDDESDINSDNPDFLEKLDECMNKLKRETDFIIDNIDDDNFIPIITEHLTNNNSINNNNNYYNNINNNNEHDDCKIVKPIPIRNKSLRRNSMLPGSEMCSDVAAFASGFKLPECYQEQLNDECINDNSPDLLVDALKSNDVLEPIKTLKTLTMNNEVKQTQVKIIKEELDDAHKRIDELQKTIKMKEEIFIGDMVKNSESRKQKLHKKRFKVKKELGNRGWATDKSISSLRNEKCHRDVELYKNIAIHYEQRLVDIEKIKQIAGDSAKKILELEMSLNASKVQMEKLQWQLKKEEERKSQLEDEVAEDQKKIKELVEKCNLTESKLQEMKSESEDERASSRMKDADQKILESSRMSLDFLKIKSLNERAENLKEASDRNEIKILRDEIKELRFNKENLVTQTVDLVQKIKLQERKPTEDEERKKLEWNESIEMIDTLIEKKNSRISRLSKLGGISKNSSSNVEESSVSNKEMINELLSNLRDNELKDLFHVYYNKVIELKKSTGVLDEQNALYEAECQRLRKANHDLMVKFQQKHSHYPSSYAMTGRGSNDKQLQMVVRNFNHQEADHEEKMEMEKLRRENKTLHKKLKEMLNIPKWASQGSSRYPRHDFNDIKPSSQDKLMTKVTRERNKIIIQKTDCVNKKK
ncbi:kinesin-like protein costa [Cotesia glomerata]|uniref:Uncharacterized protein n=1 Tax=Cotesia glomerata TaxID=32391 RepID=A0AAV7IB46_COTGL|nr:kinesin-like protein costa [Cotesia glomerata]KAH0549475.1 hypothetical protein KQX54_009529 [Cotesia glomerata]